MSCKRTQGFLAKHHIGVRRQIDAGKDRHGKHEALTLARQASRIVVARGKKVTDFDMKKSPAG